MLATLLFALKIAFFWKLKVMRGEFNGFFIIIYYLLRINEEMIREWSKQVSVTTLKWHILLKGNFAHNSFDSKYGSMRMTRTEKEPAEAVDKSYLELRSTMFIVSKELLTQIL